MKRQLSVGSIFRNEVDYILEWVAYHKAVGVEFFFIGDNDSNDGTSALLEALESIGVLTRFFEPRVKNSQVRAYQRILRNYGHLTETIAFIDADEFIVSKNYLSVSENINKLMEPEDVAAMAIFWKVFGSSGHVDKPDGLVIENYTRHADNDFGPCTLFKTVVKPSCVIAQGCHHSIIPKFLKYIDVNGNADFDFNENGGLVRPVLPIEGPLQINHYVIKSLAEFKKKKKRGRAIDPSLKREFSYFKAHDRNECEDLTLLSLSLLVKEKIELLKQRLREESVYFDVIQGSVGTVESRKISGWAASTQHPERNVSIKILINDTREYIVPCYRYRPDVATKTGLSAQCGFLFRPQPPLMPNDKVRVSVYGNSKQFNLPAKSKE